MKENQKPIFIICTGRSGSTLLRYILDAHDMISAPQELHLGPMIREMTRIVDLLYEDKIPQEKEREEVVTSQVRNQIESMMRSTLKSEIWCDKSVSSIDFLDEIIHVFPKARYLFLYRDCLDFVYSALEVSKYGFKGFWFEDYVLKNPRNIVDGLVNFWCMQTEKRIDLHSNSQYDIYPIKYEDIVHEPQSTTQSLFKFLELPFEPKILDNLFKEFKSGKGDLKIQSSNKINNNTGKGRYVPLKHIEEKSFLRMNKVLKQIGYAEVDHNYNFADEATTLSDGLKDYSIKRVYDFFLDSLANNPIPSELREKNIRLDISGVDGSPWLLDLEKRRIEKNANEAENASMNIKLNLDTLLKIIDRKLNISWAYREGFVETNGTYQELNEVGKYLFG